MIQYAILGLLSSGPLSGYDLKKLFADSSTLYWSGNSNQIYRSLVQLHEQGLVTYEVKQQADYPAKKLYSLTSSGLEALKDWLRTTPELPEQRSEFLIRLAWGHLLDEADLSNLIAAYQEEVRLQLLMEREKTKRKASQAAANPTHSDTRRLFFSEMIEENTSAFYEHELEWLERLKSNIPGRSAE